MILKREPFPTQDDPENQGAARRRDRGFSLAGDSLGDAVAEPGEARKDKQYNAAINGTVQAAKVAGAYVERTEQAIDWTGNMEDLTEAQVERLMQHFERIAWGNDTAAIEAARRKAGLNEATATEIEPQSETQEKTVSK